MENSCNHSFVDLPFSTDSIVEILSKVARFCYENNEINNETQYINLKYEFFCLIIIILLKIYKQLKRFWISVGIGELGICPPLKPNSILYKIYFY